MARASSIPGGGGDVFGSPCKKIIWDDNAEENLHEALRERRKRSQEHYEFCQTKNNSCERDLCNKDNPHNKDKVFDEIRDKYFHSKDNNPYKIPEYICDVIGVRRPR